MFCTKGKVEGKTKVGTRILMIGKEIGWGK